MNKPNKLIFPAILCLCIAAIIFCYKWQQERNNHTELLELAQWSAEESYDSFAAFIESGEEHNYWEAVANFRSFLKAYMQYCLKSNLNHTDYTYATDVYYSLINFPELCRTKIPELMEITALLSVNADDPDADIKMHNLRDDITQ